MSKIFMRLCAFVVAMMLAACGLLHQGSTDDEGQPAPPIDLTVAVATTESDPEPEEAEASEAPVTSESDELARLRAENEELRAQLAAEDNSDEDVPVEEVPADEESEEPQEEVQERPQRPTEVATSVRPERVPARDALPVISAEELMTFTRTTRAQEADAAVIMQGQTVNQPWAPRELRGVSPLNALMVSPVRGPFARILICSQEGAVGSPGGASTDRLGYTRMIPIYPQRFTVMREGARTQISEFSVRYGGQDWGVQFFPMPDSLVRYLVATRDPRTGEIDTNECLSFYGEYAERDEDGNLVYTRISMSLGHASQLSDGQTRLWVDWSNHWLGLAPQHREHDNTHQIAFYSRYLERSNK